MIECLLINNDCYKKYSKCVMTPVGGVLHSTAPTETGELSRFIQPVSGQTGSINGKLATEAKLFQVIGKNRYNNHWNKPGVEKAVHVMIGLDAGGEVAACQTLHYNMPCWGCGSGSNGSYNGCYGGVSCEPLYIQIEMIEDKNGSLEHCQKLYSKAVEVFAMLAKAYPKVGKNIVSHAEAHRNGFASDHGDPENYWSRVGATFTMDGFRADVISAMSSSLFDDVRPDAWYAEYVYKVVGAGLMRGKSEKIFAPHDMATRAELAAILSRLLDRGI